jgi:hypothetical protein
VSEEKGDDFVEQLKTKVVKYSKPAGLEKRNFPLVMKSVLPCHNRIEELYMTAMLSFVGVASFTPDQVNDHLELCAMAERRLQPKAGNFKKFKKLVKEVLKTQKWTLERFV